MLELLIACLIKGVHILLVFGSLLTKYSICIFPPLVKSFSTSYVGGFQNFFYLLLWNDSFFPMVLLSVLYDSWLVMWHLDYNFFVTNNGLTLPLDQLEPPISDPTLPTPEEIAKIKNRLSEEAAYTSFKKLTFGWILVGGFLLHWLS